MEFTIHNVDGDDEHFFCYCFLFVKHIIPYVYDIFKRLFVLDENIAG